MADYEKITTYLKENGPFFFATVDDGAARVRPFGFNMMFEGKLYFGVGTHKASYAEMVKNPEVELCACGKGGFLRIRGTAVMDPRPEVQTAMFEQSPMLARMYNEETGHRHECFYLENISAWLCPMGGEPEVL